MGKKSNFVKKGKGSIVATITNSLNKHGEIKGSNKKETKNLKAMCVHHKINKKGKIKPTVWNNGNGELTCTCCGRKIPTKLFNKQDSKTIVSKFIAILDQAKYMAVAGDLGEETVAYLCKLGVDITNFEKTYKKIKNVTERTEHTKNKKKGKHDNSGYGSGSENYGGWR